MKSLITSVLLTIGIGSVVPALSQAAEFTSGSRSTDVLELYTSEGCSSCPPADRWFTSLKDDPGVFKQFVPLAFHVDYWNYLGWDDRFATPQYTERQRQHVRAGNVSQSYTPQVVLNGEEWRGHLRGNTSWQPGNDRVGVLTAELTDNRLQVSFSPASGDFFAKKEWVLNSAYLGMGLKTAVEDGENKGRELHHDFVVLQQQQQTIAAAAQYWLLNLPTPPAAGQQQTALVVWLADPDTQQVLQAVGGYL